jgi:cobalt/nickel transport system permease protein
MHSPAAALAELGALDRLAAGESVVHQLDPRGKLLLTLAYIIVVLSFPPTQVGPLLPLAVLPLALAVAGGIPLRYIVTRVLWVLPFVLLMGASNVWFDRTPVVRVAGFLITGGMLSCASLLLRVALTVAAATVLLATTGINPLARALAGLGLPRVFVVQLVLLYRYLFVLMEQLAKLRGACALRSAGRAPTLRLAGKLLAQLLLRAIDRAARIHCAMRCRGFTGTIRLARTLCWTRRDTLLLAAGFFILAALRVIDWGILLRGWGA